MKTQTIFLILITILLTGTFSCAESQNQASAAFSEVENSDPANIIIKEEFAKLGCEEARFVKLINLYRKSLKLSNASNFVIVCSKIDDFIDVWVSLIIT